MTWKNIGWSVALYLGVVASIYSGKISNGAPVTALSAKQPGRES